MPNTRKVDHLVYAVPDLEVAMDEFEQLSGLRPTFGGYHQGQGTKNALVHLGEGRYLELLAVDEANTKRSAPRWMGVDEISRPQLTRWCLKSDDLAYDGQVLKAYHPAMGQLHQGQRQTSSGTTLSWQMLLPLASPAIELLPFMTDWQNSEVHPTDSLPKACQLLEVELVHPSPGNVQPSLDQLGVKVMVSQGETIRIKARISTPQGEIWL